MAEPKVSIQAAHVSSGSNLPVTRIVIHATCPMLGFPRASAAGQARSTARYFTSAGSGGSAHYVEDVASEEHCVADSKIAWHAPPNGHSIGIEICADGGSAAAYRSKPSANYTREQWLSPQVWPAVKRAAARTRELCDRYGIPKVQLTSAQVRAGEKGICGHINVSEAFGQTDHSDPGPAFPWAEFMQEVTGTTVKPATPVQEDDMPTVQEVWTGTPVVKNVTAKNPDTAPRVAPSFLLELAAKNSMTTVAQLAGLTAAVKALAESKPGVDPAALLATVQKTVDAGVTAALADLSVTLSTKEG